MAIIVKTKETDESSSLNALIKDRIDKRFIVTWSYDKDGDFFHSTSSAQWEESGWIHFHQTKGQKKLNIAVFGYHLCNGKEYDQSTYAIYMGRFAEMLITHFSDNIVKLEITPAPIADYDTYVDCW